MDMRRILSDCSEMELFVMLGLLIREHNYSLISHGKSPEWIQLVEKLFWMIDCTGRGLVTQDGTQSDGRRNIEGTHP